MEHRRLGILAILHQPHPQVGRYVAHRRDLVGGRASGEQLAGVVPHQFFHGQPAQALNETAFHLADVDGRIQGRADVVEDIGAQQPVFTGEGVDQHLGAGGAERIVVEGPATGLVAVVVDLGRAVVAGTGKRYLADVGQLDQLLEAQQPLADPDVAVAEFHLFRADVEVPAGEIDQPVLDGLGRVLGGLAVEVGTAGSRRGRGVGYLVGIGGGDLDATDVDLEDLGHHLGDLGVQALAHLGATVVQVDAAIGIDVDQRTALVEEGGGEGDAELDRGQRQALLQHRVGPVEGLDGFASSLVVATGRQVRGHLFEQIVFHHLVVVGDMARLLAVVVAPPHLQRIQATVAGDGVHDVLDGQHALGAAEAAVGGVGRQVGLAAVAGDLGVAEEIGIVGMEHGAIDDGVGQIRRIPAVARQLEADAQQAPVVIEANVVFDMEGVALAGHMHVFKARQAHLHRASGKTGKYRAERRRHPGLALLAAKAAAHASHVDGDPVHGDAQHLGHLLLYLGGILGGGIDQHAAVFGG